MALPPMRFSWSNSMHNLRRPNMYLTRIISLIHLINYVLLGTRPSAPLSLQLPHRLSHMKRPTTRWRWCGIYGQTVKWSRAHRSDQEGVYARCSNLNTPAGGSVAIILSCFNKPNVRLIITCNTAVVTRRGRRHQPDPTQPTNRPKTSQETSALHQRVCNSCSCCSVGLLAGWQLDIVGEIK